MSGCVSVRRAILERCQYVRSVRPETSVSPIGRMPSAPQSVHLTFDIISSWSQRKALKMQRKLNEEPQLRKEKNPLGLRTINKALLFCALLPVSCYFIIFFAFWTASWFCLVRSAIWISQTSRSASLLFREPFHSRR